MGFTTTLDESIVVAALQSVKELKDKLFSFERSNPPWGFFQGTVNQKGC
jgi:hypothetical protein